MDRYAPRLRQHRCERGSSMVTEIKPIRTKRDYEAALKEIDRLWGEKAGTPEGDRLDVLATLIDAYESEHYPMDPPDPVEAIQFRMEQQGLSRKDLEPLIGTRTRVAEVLTQLAQNRGLERAESMSYPKSRHYI